MNERGRIVGFLVAAFFFAGFVPAHAGPAAPRRATVHHVEASAGPSLLFQWDPADLAIAVGDKVMWMNPTSAPHRVVPYDGPWEKPADLPAEEGEVTMRFKEPGLYKYRCDIPSHSVLAGEECIGMCGTVAVE